MKKNNGFFLSELVIVISVVLLASVSLYSYTTSVIKSSTTKERYNSVDSIYRAKNIKDYLFRFEKINELKTALSSDSDKIISVSFNEPYFNKLLEENQLNIKKILFLNSSVSSNTLKSYSDTGIDKDFKRFLNWASINKMRFGAETNKEYYKLIIKYEEKNNNNEKNYAIIDVVVNI